LGLFRSDDAARSLTVVLGCVSILPVRGLARRIGDERVGFAAALLIAVSPLHAWHSQEGRGYALYYLVTALACWSFFRALETNRDRDRLAYAGCGVIGLYRFVILLLTNVLEPLSRARISGAALAHSLLVEGTLPLAWLARPDFAFEATTAFAVPFRPGAIAYSCLALPAGYSIGPSGAELHKMTTAEAASSLGGWLTALGAGVVVLAIHGAHVLGR
jgi:hypothetical protein